MDGVARMERLTLEQDQRITEVVRRERSRLLDFIRKRLPDPVDVEDVVQFVFTQFVEANRLLTPIEHVTAWLYRVARNRIVDLVRKRQVERITDATIADEGGDLIRFEEMLPSPDAGPDALYARRLLLEAFADAVEDLPDEQRAVFVAHELEGRSFKELAAETGVNINTLLSRKRYAVLHLRERLRRIYDDFWRT